MIHKHVREVVLFSAFKYTTLTDFFPPFYYSYRETRTDLNTIIHLKILQIRNKSNSLNSLVLIFFSLQREIMSLIFHNMVKIYEVLDTAKIECIGIDNKV